MGELREKHTIIGPFPDVDPLDTARLFLRTNRYQIVDEERGAPPVALKIVPLDHDEADANDAQIESSEESERSEPSSVSTDSSPSDDDSADDGEDAPDATEEAAGDDGEDAPSDPEDGSDGAQDHDDDAAGDDDGGSEAGEDDDDAARDETSEGVKDEVGEGDAPTVQEADGGDDVEPGDVLTKFTATRGEKWSGLTSSNMSDLLTNLEVNLVGNSVVLSYEVITTGQFLDDSERGYWKREAKALEQFLKGKGSLISVASDEEARARSARGDRMTSALWTTMIVFAIMFILGIFIARTIFK